MKTIKGFDCPGGEECTLTEGETVFINCPYMVSLYYKAILQRMLGAPVLAKQLLDITKVIARRVNCIPARNKLEL